MLNKESSLFLKKKDTLSIQYFISLIYNNIKRLRNFYLVIAKS